jgi:hypothetical protein
VITPEVMREVCRRLHAFVVDEAFGTPGVEALFTILELVRDLYRHVEPENMRGPVIVFVRVQLGENLPNGQLCTNLALLSTQTSGIILELRPDGRTYLHSGDIGSAEELARTAVVYHFEPTAPREVFLAGTQASVMIPYDPSATSQFSVPTFFTLDAALQEYRIQLVRHSGCPVLSEAWADPNRLFFKPGPEEMMRKSLTLFLKSRLGAAYEVRPEQVMDESHPVDIKVTYSMANRLMIIEIKWLGDSRNQSGGIGTSHRDARAKEGARQLADYLDQNRVQAPLHVTRGYYVVIDARRRGLTETSRTISRENGMHYESEEIEYDPAYHETRDDFEPPYRMFIEPICEA